MMLFLLSIIALVFIALCRIRHASRHASPVRASFTLTIDGHRPSAIRNVALVAVTLALAIGSTSTITYRSLTRGYPSAAASSDSDNALTASLSDSDSVSELGAPSRAIRLGYPSSAIQARRSELGLVEVAVASVYRRELAETATGRPGTGRPRQPRDRPFRNKL